MPTVTRLGPIKDRLTTDESAIAAVQADVADLRAHGVPIGDAVIAIQHAGVAVGSRATLNLIEQSGVQLTVTDDPTDGKVNVTIQADLNGGYF